MQLKKNISIEKENTKSQLHYVEHTIYNEDV